MRFSPMMRNGPRSLHSSNARFLNQQPPLLPFRDLQQRLCAKTKSKIDTFKSKTVNITFSPSKIDTVIHAKSICTAFQQSKIPNSSAPKINSHTKLDTDQFTLVTSKMKKKKRFCTLTPKKYYSTQKDQKIKESPQSLSPFLQYQQMMETEC